ncbi:MAG: CDP-alcohol phosphatidyltransferase family protein [Acidobacteria bacterium]|nr:CDP-alcohol phosphatidyltransferase family protein [Acidobacteriota bacterium]
MRHIPNILTVLRILATPVILNRIWVRDLDTALVLFFLSGMTDTIDGTLARRYGWSSKIGAIIDPIADKTLLVSVFIALFLRSFIPFWLVAIVIGRDILILAAAGVLKLKGRLTEFPPSVFGKISTLVQLLTAGSILLRWPLDPSPFFYATALMAFLSFAHYAYQIWRKLN